MPKPVVLRELARRDLDAAADFYLAEASEAVALRFIDAVEAAFRAIGAHPGAGSPRYAHELETPGLRTKGVRGFPFLIFYYEGERQVDVWRVLNATRDIPTWLREG